MDNVFDLIEIITNKRSNCRIIWLFNIGTEKYWSDESYSVKDTNEELLLTHVEEMNLLLTRKQDILILRKRPDERFLKYLEEIGFEVPQIICPKSNEDDCRSISEIILEDENFLKLLSGLNKNEDDVYFVPYGISFLEEKISQICNLRMIGTSSSIVKQINDKAFSRNLAEQLGLKVTEGKVCNSFEQIEEEYYKLKCKFNRVIIKQCCGASGKGLYVVDNDRKLKSTIMILKHFTKSKVNSKWIVEGWYEKKCDINYQIYVREDGEVNVFSIKEQLLDETKYIGSVVPPRISCDIIEKYKSYGEIIGQALHKIGFNGVLGVDSFISEDDLIIPIIEINARFTLSTYISFLPEKFHDKSIYSFYERLTLKDGISFNDLENLIRKNNLGFDLRNNTGLFCYVSETMKDNVSRHNGRLFVAIIGDSYQENKLMKEKLDRALESIRR
ncbi:ATP-grasp domain-containing protein [Inconstantimicrobium mannanitabidum]|uniref:Uncharacterized protein n=1 Tax=Inconstantimicrobium mannanitabidum TaxID=1604901 RepID=A0ACB5RH45_9CLOT|nr:ATP-grasp domain-containing protein [Clostridium sp. TW13]GKX68389.1 hypothetical protein rsdtw13_36470 [Clostridium sp. TW13]